MEVFNNLKRNLLYFSIKYAKILQKFIGALMKNSEKKNRPTYFIWVIIVPILAYIGESILNSIIAQYLPTEFISKILQFKISIKILLPIFLAVIVLIICLFVYNKKYKNTKFINIKHKDLQIIENSINRLSNEYSEIESIQAYQYSIIGDEQFKYIKTNFLVGWANERIDINSILQAYYRFPYRFYKKINNFSSDYEESAKAESAEKKISTKNNYLKKGMDLSEELLSSLNSITDVESIKEYHCELYRALLVVLNAINETPVETALKKPSIEAALVSKKRTGLLGAIFLRDIYIFKNQNSLSKKRIYFAFPYNISKRSKIIFSIAMNNGYNEQEEIEDLEIVCKEIFNSMQNILKEEKEKDE